MAVQSEGAVVERRNVCRNRLMLASADRAAAKMHDVAHFVYKVAEIRAWAKTLHNERCASLFVKLGGITVCGLGVNNVDMGHYFSLNITTKQLIL